MTLGPFRLDYPPHKLFIDIRGDVAFVSCSKYLPHNVFPNYSPLDMCLYGFPSIGMVYFSSKPPSNSITSFYGARNSSFSLSDGLHLPTSLSYSLVTLIHAHMNIST